MGERARAGSSNHAAVVAGARVCSGRRRLPHRGRARLNRRRVGRGLHCSWSRENGERAGREVLPVSHAVINKLGGRRERRRRKELKKVLRFAISIREISKKAWEAHRERRGRRASQRFVLRLWRDRKGGSNEGASLSSHFAVVGGRRRICGCQKRWPHRALPLFRRSRPACLKEHLRDRDLEPAAKT